LILLYEALCKNGDDISCDLFEKTFARYKYYYTLRNQDDETILKEIRIFTEEQIKNI
jgi:hypothetical protein